MTVKEKVAATASKSRAVRKMLGRDKYEAELGHWRVELDNLHRWFVDRSVDWWGVAPPTDEQCVLVSPVWSTNAVLTLHALRPTYLVELELDAAAFAGARVLEVGCGPMTPILQFSDCERHGLDPLADRYLELGWPLYDYDVHIVNAPGERMPYADAYFDAVVSVNALDHVDNFDQVAHEIQRVLRPGGRLCIEVEYHEPTTTEPLRLDDTVVRAAFDRCELQRLVQRGAAEIHERVSEQFGLVNTKFIDVHGSAEAFTTWHGVRR